MEILDAIRANLLSPAVLFFALGLVAALTKSDLKFPEALYVGLTIYLLVAIGFKGGVAIAVAGIGQVWLPALAAMVLGALYNRAEVKRHVVHHCRVLSRNSNSSLVFVPT